MCNFHGRQKSFTLFQQVAHYLFIGILSNSFGYLLYLLITYLGVTPKLAMTFIYITSATLGFIGNRRLTFDHKGEVFDTGIRYCFSHLIGYSINLCMLIVFVDCFGYQHQWVQVISIFIVALFLFIVFKYFVFAEEHRISHL